jgi:hypothetical protein
MTVKMSDYPEYQAATARLDDIRNKIDEHEATKREILGNLSESERIMRSEAVENAAEQVWRTGDLAIETERDVKLRQNLKRMNEQLAVLRKAAERGERELLDIRRKRSAEVAAANRDEYRSCVVAVAHAAAQFANAVAAQKAFVESFHAAGFFPGFALPNLDEAAFDPMDSGSVPSMLVYDAIKAGYLTGREDWVKGIVNFDGNLKRRK